MKKIIFAAIALFILSQCVNAQISVKKEEYKVPYKNSHSFGEVYTALADAYGIKDLQLVQFKNGRYIPVRAEEVNGISEVQIGTEVITIFAIIGAILVAVLIIKAL